MATTYLQPPKKKTGVSAMPSIDTSKPLTGFKGFNVGGNQFSNVPTLNSVPNQAPLPKVGTVSGGQVNTLAMGKPDFPISSQSLTKNPATTSVKPPMSTPAPTLNQTPTPTQVLGGGFKSSLDPMDPAAIGGSLMNRTAPSPLQPITAPTRQPLERLPDPPIPQAPSQIDALRRSYLDTFSDSPEEEATRAQLDAISGRQAMLRANADAGQQALAERPTEMGFITGQQSAVERRLQTLLGQESAQAVPLQSKLASYQAQQEQRRKMAEAELGFAQKDREAEQVTPIEVGGRLVNPRTGQVVYESPEDKEAKTYTLSPGQRVFDAQGNVIAENPAGAGSDKLTSVSPGSTIIDANGNVVFSAPEKGEAGAAEQDARTAESLKGKIQLIDNLLASPGKAGSVGAYGITRLTPLSPDKAQRQDFAAGVMQLISQDTLDALLSLKAQGGTLGALSGTEQDMLRQSASRIGSWIQKDKNGNPTGKFEISEKYFDDELKKIRSLTQSALERAQGSAQGMPGVGPSGTIEDPHAFLDSF